MQLTRLALAVGLLITASSCSSTGVWLLGGYTHALPYGKELLGKDEYQEALDRDAEVQRKLSGYEYKKPVPYPYRNTVPREGRRAP